MQSLTRADVKRWQADVAAGKTAIVEKMGLRAVAHVEGGKGTAARSLASFRAMLSWAVEREMIADNPAKGVRPFAGRSAGGFSAPRKLRALVKCWWCCRPRVNQARTPWRRSGCWC